MNTITRKTGLYAAASAIMLTLIFIVSVLIYPPDDFVSAEIFIEKFKTAQLIPFILGFLLVLANIPLFAALYYFANNEKKVLGLSAVLFGAGYMVCSGINYFLQTGMLVRNIGSNNVEEVGMFLMLNPVSFSYAADNLGYTFLSLAFIFFSGIFNRRGFQSWIKTFCLLFGISGLLGSLGYLLNSPLLENMVIVSALPYLVCVILIFIEFKRINIHE